MRRWPVSLQAVIFGLLFSGIAALSQAQQGSRVVDQIVATACTNQFVRSIAASGAATCATVAAATDVSGLAGTGNITGRAGGLDVWQRGTSLTQAASVTAYVNDGWYLITGANQASVVARSAAIATGSIWSAKITRNVTVGTGTTVMRYAMPLNSGVFGELEAAQGQFIALSFTAKAGLNWSPASGTLNYIVYCGTGSPGKRGASAYTGETTPISSSVNITTTATRTTATSAGTVAANCTQMEIQFNWTPVGTAGGDDSVTLDDVQLEVVSSASASASTYQFATAADQLRRGLPYLLVIFPATTQTSIGIGQAISTTDLLVTFPLPLQMRTTPTLAVSSVSADFRGLTAAAAPANCSNVTLNDANPFAATIDCVTTGLVAGNASIFQNRTNTATLAFSGEL